MAGGKIKRIILFKGDIETTAYFSMQMEKTFIREGYETFFYDYGNVGGSIKKLLLFIAKGDAAVVTFNFHGLCGESEVIYDEEKKEYIWDTFHIPCINIVVDHPFYYHRFFPKMPKRYIHISIDRNHEKYMEEFFPEIERGPFLPLAGTSLYPAGDYKPISQRSMDIVFTGNYVRPGNFNVYIERAGDEYTRFYMGILEELKAHPASLLEDVARKHLLMEIPEASHDEVRETLGNMIFLDMYIRFYFRGEAVRILAEAGYPVHVFGSGWEELECGRKENVIIGGSLDSLGCLEKISDGKISLNVMPWFKEGAHDRIFNSMLNGALCLTDSSGYLDGFLKQNENAAIYSLENINKLPEIADSLLKDQSKMQEIAHEGFEMAKKYHTWEYRTMKIIEILHTMN
ncbi:MAG: glycosyltransferase family 1 protein [Lachnospiraceae bacterium]|nr:glycosyltransferase family 1 protein [Lachnospiraceae bacterium]